MLTIVMAVYGQPKMLAHQLATISRYDDAVLDDLTVIIVDDCGSPPAVIPSEIAVMCKFKLIRVTEDIPWNQMGARNIGMQEAANWCVMLDPDMVIEPEMIAKFMAKAKEAKRGVVTKFALKWPGHPLDFTSPNTWFIHRDDFFAAGGYDENFRGHKGWSDCLLQECLNEFYKVVADKTLWVTFHHTSQGFGDAQVKTAKGVGRNTSYNKRLKVKTADLVRRMGGWRRFIARGLNGKRCRCPSKRIL